jgi:hypothetical protein
MEIKKIQIVTEIENIYDEGVDVIVTLDDGFSYVIDVVTPKYMLSLMKERNQNFLEPGENFIVVRKLTPEIIEETVKAFVEENDAYWLKLLHISAYFDIETLNNVRDEIISKYHLEN